MVMQRRPGLPFSLEKKARVVSGMVRGLPLTAWERREGARSWPTTIVSRASGVSHLRGQQAQPGGEIEVGRPP